MVARGGRGGRRWMAPAVVTLSVISAVGLARSSAPEAAQTVEPCRYGLASSADGTSTGDPFDLPGGTPYTVRAISSGAAINGTALKRDINTPGTRLNDLVTKNIDC